MRLLHFRNAAAVIRDMEKNYTMAFGVALAFAIWLYCTGFVVLIGAQFNAELLDEARGRPAPEAKRAEPKLAA